MFGIHEKQHKNFENRYRKLKKNLRVFSCPFFGFGV